MKDLGFWSLCYTFAKDLHYYIRKLRKQDSPEELNNKGVELAKQHKYDEAIKCFDEAIKLKPKLEQPWFNKGFALIIHKQDYKNADRCFDEAIKLNPVYVDALINRGFTLFYLDDLVGSIDSTENALKLLIPRLALAYNNKGIAFGKQGKYDDAIECFNEAIRLKPDFAYAWYNKGLALEELGRRSEAEAAYQRARELGLVV